MFKSGLKFIIVTLLVLVALVCSFNYTIRYIVNNNLVDIINYKRPNRIYDYTYSNATLDLWNGDLEIHDVTIHPRKNILDSLARIGQHKRILLEGSLNTLQLLNLNILRLVVHQEILIDSFLLIKPSIDLHLNTKVKGDNSETFTKDLIAETLSYGKINFLSLENASIRWIGIEKDTAVYFSCDSVSLTMTNIYTDSTILKKKEPIAFKELLFIGRNFKINTLKDFLFGAKSIEYCYSKNMLELKTIVFKNKLDKVTYTQNQHYEKEWYDIAIPRMNLTSKNTLRWIEGGYLNINKISIDQPNVRVYRDKRLTNPLFKEKSLPSHAIRNISFPLLIDTIEINQGKIQYEEIVETGKNPGKVSFTDFHVNAFHLTNIDRFLKKDANFTVNLKTLLFGEAPIDVQLKFPIQDQSDKFYASGNIKNLEAVTLNKLLSNMAFVEFKKGYIHFLSFQFTANNDSAIGTIDAHYTDLKIAILDTNELFSTRHHKQKKAMGLVANTFLKTNNIPNTKHYVQGNINAERKKEKFIFNYLWQCIKSGLISTTINPKLYAKVVTAKKKKAEKTAKEEASAKTK